MHTRWKFELARCRRRFYPLVLERRVSLWTPCIEWDSSCVENRIRSQFLQSSATVGRYASRTLRAWTELLEKCLRDEKISSLWRHQLVAIKREHIGYHVSQSYVLLFSRFLMRFEHFLFILAFFFIVLFTSRTVLKRPDFYEARFSFFTWRV